MDRLEEIRNRVAQPIDLLDDQGQLIANADIRWLLAEVERLESDVNTWRWEHGAALKRAETLDETSEIMKRNYDAIIEELRENIKEQMNEIEQLHAALKLYANSVSWWWDDERRTWIWVETIYPMTPARRALEGREE